MTKNNLTILNRGDKNHFVPVNEASVCLLSQTGEKREIYHFHYTTWPDFGVPESPASFLNFLFKVRESGALGVDHGPAVVHCSAGIGRSGTFSLVDTCVVLVNPASLFYMSSTFTETTIQRIWLLYLLD